MNVFFYLDPVIICVVCVTSCLCLYYIDPFPFTGGTTFSWNIYHNIFMLEYYSVSVIFWQIFNFHFQLLPTEGAACAPPTQHLSVKDAPPCFVDRSNQPGSVSAASHSGVQQPQGLQEGHSERTYCQICPEVQVSYFCHRKSD